MEISNNFKFDKVMKFGSADWYMLEVNDNKVLLLSQKIVKIDAYNPSNVSTSWDICNLRNWLNTDFYNKFSEKEQNQIVTMQIKTENNPRFDTECGEETLDKVFLLSVSEVAKYFGDSGQLVNGNPNSKWWVNDQYNKNRVANDEKGKAVWWWLRTPGMHKNTAVYVNTGGSINLAGHRSYDSGGGIRPAIWVKF
ncbi:hypothetical protein FACS1894132_11270 [Clostridia bacterium]|nr:hypothetical protein FACS1894132_11270 [Clostridia bacterium]